ncbi:MAG: DUF2784 domain-containing protein [Calditrichaceae bacterium]|jgi:hypothetical protein
MLARLLADLIVLFHFAFILFVVFGGFLGFRCRWFIWLHIPCAVWGGLIEFAGWICPLTPWENSLRIAAGDSGYGGSFIEHYIVPVIYPSGLTSDVQSVLGIIVIAVNILAYFLVWKRRKK